MTDGSASKNHCPLPPRFPTAASVDDNMRRLMRSAATSSDRVARDTGAETLDLRRIICQTLQASSNRSAARYDCVTLADVGRRWRADRDRISRRGECAPSANVHDIALLIARSGWSGAATDAGERIDRVRCAAVPSDMRVWAQTLSGCI